MKAFHGRRSKMCLLILSFLLLTSSVSVLLRKSKQASKKKKSKEYQEVALGYELYQGIFVLKKTTIHPSNFHS